MLWIYWLQSVIIGVFQAARMLSLRRFSTAHLRINGMPAQPTLGTKTFIVAFFLMHYGLFHLGYGLLLSQHAPLVLGLLPFAALFVINHAISLRDHLRADENSIPNIGALMFLPYARIVPMHIILILGARMPLDQTGLALFLALKTAADALMHVIEHSIS